MSNARSPRVHRSTCIFVLILLSITAALSQSSATDIDKVLVIKHERLLRLVSRGKIVKTYKVALGTEPVGAKQRQGDHRTPEGTYVLDSRNAHSHFYKAIHISYPSPEDKTRAEAAHVAPGGDVYLHGLPNGFGAIGSAHTVRNWTDGCIAVTDNEIDEIWNLVKNGTPIEIRP